MRADARRGQLHGSMVISAAETQLPLQVESIVCSLKSLNSLLRHVAARIIFLHGVAAVKNEQTADMPTIPTKQQNATFVQISQAEIGNRNAGWHLKLLSLVLCHTTQSP